jgi:glycosyltransferase involved in cell wall biosynthesis
MPLVSVIMVAHCDTRFLRPAIRSVLRQTWTDLELVLVDNGIGLGRDQLGDLGKDSRLRILNQSENLGMPAGFNEGLKNCRGEFIALLDYDDLALPDRIERQVAGMRQRPELGMLFMAAETIDRLDCVTGTEFTLISECDHRRFGVFDMPATTPTFMCRRTVADQVRYRAPFDVAADFDFFTRISDRWPTAALPAIGIRYRRHAEQATSARRTHQVLSANLVRLLTARRRSGRTEGLDEILEELRDWIAEPPSLKDQYAYFARRSLREGFLPLAVYFARASLRDSRGPGAIWRAGLVLLNVSALQPSRIPLHWRLFFTGPLRTFGLRPRKENSAD